MKLLLAGWRDMFEILIFSTIFYQITLWLKKDTTRNLLPYFYGTLACGFLAHVLNLPTISYFLFLFAPSLAALFILVHQETLQRNVVSLKNITAARQGSINWLETLIRSCLVVMNEGKEFFCIIENSDNIAPFLQCPIAIDASINQSLLSLLFGSPLFNEKKMVWINRAGSLQGINVAWRATFNTLAPSTLTIPLETWKDEAQLYTSKTDCIVLYLDPTTRLFTLVVQGNVSEKIGTHTILSYLQKYLPNTVAPSKNKGVSHVTAQAHSARQRTP